MSFNPVIEKYRNKVSEVVLGATKAEGGTREYTLSVGGESTLPFLHFEGEMPNRPVLALEIWDVPPQEWHGNLGEFFEDVYEDTASWAKKCVEEHGADLLQLTLKGADPDGEDKTPEECAAVVKQVLSAVGCPLIVVGCGNHEKDNLVLPKVAEEAAGENLLIGVAEQENYNSLAAACLVYKHSIIAQSPIDINICKQLNILITEMNLPAERIVIDPCIAALGYGIEYGYSIMERARLGALQGDSMLAMPMIGNVGGETWRVKEAVASEDDFPDWGAQEKRGVLWEATTAMALLQAGLSIAVLRHPETLRLVKQHVAELMEDNSYE